VLVPEAAGVLSALGLVAGEERRDRVASYVRPLAEVRDLPERGEADLRYRGQSFELTVPLGPDQGGGDVAASFNAAHEERYGYADPEREIELVAVRTADVVPGPELALHGAERRAVAGPALVELPGATCWVPRGWSGETNHDGTLVLTR
jgi:N-methylhydantoinase A/oxoprolinase/acetone carboxylase beta subunit